MTIDTTRLRADAEAVRDAGAVMRAAREHSDHALTAASADEYRKAAEAFRSAQKALYRDAPPDGIILALLDEVEGLRARPTWERVLRLAEGSHDYGGGYHGGEYEAFQHGISTVCNVLKAASKQGDKADMQLRVVEAIGTDAMREPEEGGTP